MRDVRFAYLEVNGYVGSRVIDYLSWKWAIFRENLKKAEWLIFYVRLIELNRASHMHQESSDSVNAFASYKRLKSEGHLCLLLQNHVTAITYANSNNT
jgi:hypothetical protein